VVPDPPFFFFFFFKKRFVWDVHFLDFLGTLFVSLERAKIGRRVRRARAYLDELGTDTMVSFFPRPVLCFRFPKRSKKLQNPPF
jgi:hypothetical protein